ncbi:MAG: DUF177 domain-containing protein [Bacteroidetes bacterium]|nr:DUF177 domain-containing protein [Bacteroidota bacterium]MCL1968117.1 DUF177 domain-containing protein [Bacteroidota bacterium]
MTDLRDDFVLRLSGIDVGNHKYSMICDKAFFELTGLTEIEEGNIKVQIEMEKSAKMLSLKFHFNGEITVICDRCLDFLTLPLDFSDFLVVNFVSHLDESFENDENIWQLHEKAHELDLTHFLYEAIELALPTQLIHPNDENGNPTCNPEMLKKLAELAPTTDEHNDTETDPRWDALKQLTINN